MQANPTHLINIKKVEKIELNEKIEMIIKHKNEAFSKTFLFINFIVYIYYFLRQLIWLANGWKEKKKKKKNQMDKIQICKYCMFELEQ